MKTSMFARLLACLILSMLTVSLAYSSSPHSTVMADGSVSIQPVADQVARIVVASQSGGVNWGNEPLVLTLRPDPVTATLSVAVNPPALLDAAFSGANGNVLTLTPKGSTGIARVTVQAANGAATASTSFKVQINKYEDTGQYKWDDLQIPGGGFVTGYTFHPAVPNILYARTDVGGAWRFDFTAHKWKNITNWVRDDITGTPGQALALGVDPNPARASYVYLVYGSSGTVVRSTDYGETWVRLGNTGGSAAGNSDSRGLGERFIVMPGDGQTMYFAGVTGGLRKSVDGGNTWTGVNLIHNNGVRNTTTNETKLGFVNYDPANPNFIIVSTAGANGNPVNSALTRGPSVFYSTNGGVSFAELPNQPLPGAQVTSGGRTYGYVGYRSTFSAPDQDGKRYMFITYSDSGTSNIGMEGQGVDGALFRYQLDASGAILNWANVTPVRITNTYIKNADGLRANRQFGVGIGGVSLDPQHPGTMVVSTHNSDFNSPDAALESRNMDGIFRSLDYGETWFPILTGYRLYGDIDPIAEKAPYTRPLINGATDNKDGETPHWEPWSFLHWNTSPTINPFDSNMMVINSGIGAFVTYNLTALDGINAAEPHAVPADGLNALQGLFISEANVITGVVSSRYNPYLIGNSANHLTAAQSVRWEAMTGLEMTVSKEAGLYSPPSGDVILLHILWDYAGFAFTSTTQLVSAPFGFPRQIPAEFQDLTNGQAVAPTDYWINGRNASFAALNPDIIVATVSTSYHYNAWGGVAISTDNGKNWYQLPDGWTGAPTHPAYARFGIGNGMPTTALQTAITTIKTGAGNVSGHAIVNANGSTIIWSVTNLNLTSQVYSTDYGQHWTQVQYLNTAGNPVTSGTTYLVADNVNPNIVYAFGTSTYVSQDGGKIFRQATTSYGSFSTSGLATINGTRELRADLNNQGVIFIGGNGLWKLTYNSGANAMTATQVPAASTVSRYGPGLGVNADPNNKALYVYGNKTGSGQQSGYGIWRSLDGGANWTKISYSTNTPSPAGTAGDPYLNANLQYADVRSVVGDARTFGRVFLSVGNVAGGVIYGEMITNLIENGAKSAQTITFPAIEEKPVNTPDFDPGASASSGLAVSYATSGNCSIVAGKIHLTGVGSCTVTASQAGDDVFNPATDVQRSFAIGIEAYPVNWIDLANTSASGNTLTKSGGNGAWDGSGASDKLIAAGPAYAQATVADTSSYVMFGLSSNHLSSDYSELDYAIYTYANTGELAVYEGGVYRTGIPGYTAGDTLRIAVEGGAVAYYRNGELIYNSNVAPTFPLQVVADIWSPGGGVANATIGGSNLTTAVPWTPTATPTATNTPIPVVSNPVNWINLLKSSASGSTLTRNAPGGAWDGGGIADQQILSGDGFAQMTVAASDSYLMFGLSNTRSGGDYNELNYAIYTYASTGQLAVYENGAFRGLATSYTSGDVLKVAVSGGVVSYLKNGVVFYTSSVAPSYPLMVVGDIWTSGGQLTNAQIAGSDLDAIVPWTPTATPTATSTPLPQVCNPVVFASLVNVNASGNTIAKTSPINGWNAGAVSNKSILSGDGSVSATVADSLSYTMFGLGSGNNNGAYAPIKYAIYTYASSGQLAIYESGAYRGNVGSYSSGDVLKVAVEAGVVNYYKNGGLIYTSTVVPSYPLLLNSAIFTPGGQISNAQLCGANLSTNANRIDPNGGKSSLPAKPTRPGAVPGDPAVPARNAAPAQPVVPRHDDVPAQPVVPGRVSFLDVPSDFWAARYINWAVAHVSLSGYDVPGGREFRPNQTATRGQVVKLLVAANGWSLVSSGQHFSDVSANSPFYKWIETAATHNVVSGYADGTFRPNATLTRAQMVKIVVLAAGWHLAAANHQFSDVPAADWAAAYIATAAERNLVSGYADGTFRPQAALTRAQMVKLLYNGFAQ